MSHVTVVGGGLGAAKILVGLVEILPEDEIHAVIHVGDDAEVWGLRTSPDIDRVLLALAGELDPGHEWRRHGESHQCFSMARKLGMKASVQVGDRDLATHLLRTGWLRSGSNLEEVTSQLAERFGVGVNVIPATSDPVRTWVEAADGETAPRVTPSEATPSNPMPVSAPIRYEGADQAMASARAVASIMQASRVILAPSDPVRVWDAMLAIPGLRDAIRRTKAVKIAISPIAGSQPLTGDGAELERLMKATGSAQVSVADLATRYRDVLGDLVIHTTDVDALDAVRAAGVGAWAENILIGNPEDAARLARRLVSQERGMSGAG